jgi:hypothetical protein
MAQNSDSKKRNIYFILLFFFFGDACAYLSVNQRDGLSEIRTFKVKNYTVYIASYSAVNREWHKLDLKRKSKRNIMVDGFINFRNKEI